MSLVLKNGILIGWGNIYIPIGGVLVTGIKDISYTVSQAKSNEMGQGFQPIGRTRSGYKYEALKFSILKEELDAISAAAPNNNPIAVSPFSIPIVFTTEAGVPIGRQETLSNVEITGLGRSWKEGDGALWVSIDAIYAGITQ